MKTRTVIIAILFIFVIPAIQGEAQKAPAAITLPEDLTPLVGELFKGVKGAIVIYDLKNKKYARYNKERCKQRFTPCSTFKIPNTLIALETGAVSGAEYIIPWDSKKYPAKEWWGKLKWGRDHNLRSALKNSVVWYYREVALKIGQKQMDEYLSKLNYGNKDTTGGLDIFWLCSSLEISANEQVQFLTKFYQNQLGFSPETTATAKEILILDKKKTHTLSAKTGGGNSEKGKSIGWFVGYVEKNGKEKNGNVYFFALNVEGSTNAQIKDKRIELTKETLKKLAIL